MKKFEIYKNMRKQALIWGLPLSYFALQMVSVISSLLIIIFSFSLAAIFGLVVWNALLYIGLTKWALHPVNLLVTKTFPQRISNQRKNICDHVEY
jgi:hypothetical protein